MSLFSSLNVASYASGRMRRTTSPFMAAGSTSRRTSSLSRRFTWFRATAECLKRGTISPTLSCSGSLPAHARGEAAARTSIYVVRMRFPSRPIRCSSPPRVIRDARGKPNDAFGVLRSRILIWNTNRQLLSSLLAATSKRGPTPFCFHTCTKSMRL
jgi:hypothetical protein